MTIPLSGKPSESDLNAVLTEMTSRFGERATIVAGIRQTHANSLTWVAAQLPDIVVFPDTTEEIVDIVKLCSRYRVPVIPFGTGTSFEGHVNAPWGGVSIDTSRMNRLLEVHAEDLDCVIQPGLTRKT
ncbi:MAG: FAD-binding protein, partial [Alphaproteobacteria bacterium]|nr:FAD-binding protein [Alphaproteobacteria bacterium]